MISKLARDEKSDSLISMVSPPSSSKNSSSSSKISSSSRAFSSLKSGAFSSRSLTSYLASFITSITQIGWFGVGIAMFAIPVTNRFNINLYLLVAITGLLMTATAYFGIKSLTILSAIAVPAIAILGSTSAVMAANSVGGVQGLMNIQPENKMALVTAVTLCVGSFISGGTATPDFTRFSKNKKVAVSTTVIASALLLTAGTTVS